MIPYCWAHWVEFFPQLQRLEEPYAGRAQGLAMSHGRRIYVMDNERARAQVWNDVAARWSRPEHAAEVSLANLPSGPEDAGIEVVDVIQSLVENRGERYIVNVRNGGAIPNLPDEAIVEVQAVVDAYGIRPVATGAAARLPRSPPARALGDAGADGARRAERRPAARARGVPARPAARCHAHRGGHLAAARRDARRQRGAAPPLRVNTRVVASRGAGVYPHPPSWFKT